MPSNHAFQWLSTMNNEIVAMEGRHSGRMMENRVRKCPAPSIKADSESASGNAFMKFIMRMMLYVLTAHGRSSTQSVSSSPMSFITR